jgi:hypothetical protein
MQVDDVTRNEAVVPSASLHAYGVIEGHRLKMCRGTDFDRKPARLKRLLEKIDLEFVLPLRQPEVEPCRPDTRFIDAHRVSQCREGFLDLCSNLWQRHVAGGGEVQVL